MVRGVQVVVPRSLRTSISVGDDAQSVGIVIYFMQGFLMEP